MRSDAEDSLQQQPIQQRCYDEARNNWNTAEVGHVYTMDIFLFPFSFSFWVAEMLFFVTYLVDRFREKEYFLRNSEDIFMPRKERGVFMLS